ncbi:MAG: hypothetical protein P8046_11385, partial [Anaerolineales bacterium]
MQRKNPKILTVFALVLALIFSISVTANADDTLSPTADSGTVRDPDNPVPITAPAGMTETLDLLAQESLSDIF